MMIMDSSKPLYLQVKADIKNRILSKQYMPGDKLPTVVLSTDNMD